MKNYILSLSFLFFICNVKASHNRSGEIVYTRIAPFTTVSGGVTVPAYNYSITVVKYMDHGMADRCVDTVYFGDGSKGVAIRTNGTNTCGCGTYNGTLIGCGALIVNTPNYVVKYSTYSVTHTYASPGSFMIRSCDPNRSQGVHNIPNSISVPFYLESLLVINAFTGANSSPVLTNPPIDQATVGVCFNHNVGAIDADGDSLSYELSTCRDCSGQTAPGYFHPETGSGGSFSINPVTGLLSWCNPQYLDVYNIAILIKEWRKNTSGTPQIAGTVLRDMQIIVKYVAVVGSEENSLTNIKTYPNPLNEKLHIDLGGKSYARLETLMYSWDGKLVLTGLKTNVSGNLELLIDNLETGIYILQIKTESGTLYRKVIKD